MMDFGRLEWLWRWLISHQRADLSPTAAMTQLLGTPWMLSVADGLRGSLTTPASLCGGLSDAALAAVRVEHMEALDRDDMVVVEGQLLSKWELRAVRLELEMLRQSGELAPVGQPEEVRRDEVCWLHLGTGDSVGRGSSESSADEPDEPEEPAMTFGRGSSTHNP